MSLLDLIADTKSKERALDYAETFLKEIQGINMALRGLLYHKQKEIKIKEQELAILKKRCKL